MLALSLRRQREKSGSTVREASERLGSKSPNAYAQYELRKNEYSFIGQVRSSPHGSQPRSRRDASESYRQIDEKRVVLVKSLAVACGDRSSVG